MCKIVNTLYKLSNPKDVGYGYDKEEGEYYLLRECGECKKKYRQFMEIKYTIKEDA